MDSTGSTPPCPRSWRTPFSSCLSADDADGWRTYDADVPPPDPDLAGDDWHVVDGGDRACGELLMALVEPMRQLAPGRVVRLVATDPAAPIDIPAWCHLTGHGYRGAGRGADGRPHYDLEVSAQPTPTRAGRPWRRDTTPSHNPKD